MLDVPAQLHQYNESLNAHIVEMKQEKIQLEQKITSMLGAVHNDTSIDRKTSKSIDRKTARIKKLETRISEDDIESSEISVKEAEMGVIISRFRFTAGIPTQEEFKT